MSVAIPSLTQEFQSGLRVIDGFATGEDKKSKDLTQEEKDAATNLDQIGQGHVGNVREVNKGLDSSHLVHEKVSLAKLPESLRHLAPDAMTWGDVAKAAEEAGWKHLDNLMSAQLKGDFAKQDELKALLRSEDESTLTGNIVLKDTEKDRLGQTKAQLAKLPSMDVGATLDDLLKVTESDTFGQKPETSPEDAAQGDVDFKDQQAYENHLNAIALALGKGVKVGDRTLHTTLDDPGVAGHYKWMLKHKLATSEPTEDGARESVNDDIVGRVPNAFPKDTAADEKKAKQDYENSLNAWAVRVVDNTDKNARTVQPAAKLGNEDVRGFVERIVDYKLKYDSKYDKADKKDAVGKVYDDAMNELMNRVHNVVRDKGTRNLNDMAKWTYDTYNGYMLRHGGRQDVERVIGERWDQKSTLSDTNLGNDIQDVVKGYFKPDHHGDTKGRELASLAYKEFAGEKVEVNESTPPEDVLKVMEKRPDDLPVPIALANAIREQGWYDISKGVDLPRNRQGMLADPDKYTVEQRGAAVAELSLALARLNGGVANYSDYGVAYAGRYGIELNTDPAKVSTQIQESIKKLSSGDVDAWRTDQEIQAFQKVRKSSKELDSLVTSTFDKVKDGWALQHALGQKGDTIDNLREYLGAADTLNMAAGADGKVAVENFTVKPEEGARDEITSAFLDFADNTTLSKLTEQMGPSEAALELSNRAATFMAFGIDPDEVSAAANDNVLHYFTADGTQDDLKKSKLVNDDGSFNEDFATQVVEEFRQRDPDAAFFYDEGGNKLTNSQIVTAARSIVDALTRNPGKASRGWEKGELGKALFSKDHPITKAYGAGLLHSASALLGGGVMIAKTASGGSMSEAQIISAVGNAVQSVGLVGEGIGLKYGKDRPQVLSDVWRQVTDPKGKRPAVTEALAKSRMENFRNLSRLVNATGGVMAGIPSIVLGVGELHKGNKAAGAVYLTQGIANALTPFSPYTEALLPALAKQFGKEVPARILGRIAAVGGVVSGVANVAAFLAVLGYTLYDGIKRDQREQAYFESFAPTLSNYGIDGGHDPWWDESSS